AAALQEPAFDHFDGGKERSRRGSNVAADHKHPPYAGVLLEPTEMAIEIRAARKAARRNIRHRFVAGAGQAGRDVDLGGKRTVRDSAEIYERLELNADPQSLDIAGHEPRCLELG